jgi:hypothetical protein
VGTRVWEVVRVSGRVGGVVWMMLLLWLLGLEGVRLVFVVEMGVVMLVFFVVRGLFVVVMGPFFAVMVLYVVVMGLFFLVIRPFCVSVMGLWLKTSIVGKALFVMVSWEARGLVVENVHAVVMYVVDGLNLCRYTMPCQICDEHAANVAKTLHDPGSYSGVLAQIY